MEIKNGNFYFIKENYFKKFDDKFLMKNKEIINGVVHNRPCYYAIKDKKNNIYWMIPISSKVDKYKKIYNEKIKKYGMCDTLHFGEVLGIEKAFLIQNMCPVTYEYINNEYCDAISNMPVRINNVLEKSVIGKAKRVLALQNQGKSFIFPDVLKIKNKLIAINEQQIALDQVASTDKNNEFIKLNKE
ncbi:type III toxin-antitoxin system CptIN family toxin [Clostridium sp. UBA5988]|uniref:type III toxin-antitoxin system CptIN family toxin n=1 Tax=Clostridium sp. UBA5988 TaxID=1946369 RepID=UPI003216E1FB